MGDVLVQAVSSRSEVRLQDPAQVEDGEGRAPGLRDSKTCCLDPWEAAYGQRGAWGMTGAFTGWAAVWTFPSPLWRTCWWSGQVEGPDKGVGGRAPSPARECQDVGCGVVRRSP